MFKILPIAISRLLKLPLLVLFIYFVGFALALIIAVPFYKTILIEANGSVGLDILVSKFDFMYFSDFLRVSGKAFKHFLPSIFKLGLVFLFLNVFFSGGILYSVKNKSFSILNFFSACLNYLGRFLFLFLFSFILLVILLGISTFLFFLFALFAQGGNERTYFFAMLPPLGIMVSFISFVIVQNDYAKVIIVENPKLSVSEAFWRSFVFVWRNPSTLIVFCVIVLLGLLFMLIYLCLDAIIGMHSATTIIVMVIFQQLLIFSRTFLKILTLGYANEFYSSKTQMTFLPVSLNLGENLNLDGQTSV